VKQANFLAAALLVLTSATVTTRAQVYRFEAENATLSGVTVASSASASGGKYVTNFDSSTDSLTLNVSGVPAGLYTLYLGYSSQYGHKNYGFQVGSEIGEGALDGTATGTTFATDRTAVVSIAAGSNTLKITDDGATTTLIT
jgi:hypothetical protein